MKHECERAVKTAVMIDPHPLCHSAIAALLARFDIEVVGATTSPDAAVALLQEHKPDLLVAELDLPEGREEGLRVLELGRVGDPTLTVIVLSSTDDPSLIDAAFGRGASAYVLKTSDVEVIATAVRQAFEPSLYFARPQQPAEQPVELAAPKLTRRELEILKLVSEGRSNRQVAELLWVTDQTVKFHLANVYRKLGVRSRFDAARWAFEHGVLEPAETTLTGVL
jgi:DNA-binding NarL/FixJ family response regulator